MRRAAALVESWRAEGRHAAIARPIDTGGLGPRAADDVLLVDAVGRSAGALFAGAVSAPAIDAAGPCSPTARPPASCSPSTSTTTPPPPPASPAGGERPIVVQRLDDIADEWWDAVAAGRPAALVQPVGSVPAPPSSSVPADPSGHAGRSGARCPRRSRGGTLARPPGPSARRVLVGDVELLVESWNPVPHLVIVGAAALSER